VDVLLAVIGDVRDFADEKNLASYFGIVPKVRNSNEKVKTGKITKRGSKTGRTTLVQCSLVAIRLGRVLEKLLRANQRAKRTRESKNRGGSQVFRNNLQHLAE